MKPSWRFIVLSLILAPLLLMPFWLILTDPYVAKPSPLKLYEAIHPTYYIGLLALILLIAILSIETRDLSYFALNPYLTTAVLTTLYMQLPPIALFEHPVSDHTIHLVPAFYMLREGNIYMPNYPHPETVSPQLIASILITILSLPSPLENLHRISLFVLSLLTTLYVYIFMKRLVASDRFAMMASVLNMGLIHFPFMFLRQIYAMPLYVMLAFLIFMTLKEGQVSHPIIIIVTALAFIMSDPAHVLLTIIPLILFATIWKGFNLLGKAAHRSFRSPRTFILLISITFLFWIINRHPSLFPDLWRIAKTMWDVSIRSISELALPTRESPAYWGRPTALVYNDYYMFLYRTRVMLIALSIFLPVALLAYTSLNERTRSEIFKYETLYLTSFFAVTATVLITRGYGFTYTPWSVSLTFYLVSNLRVKRHSHKSKMVLIGILMLLILPSISLAPHIINVRGMRVSTPDIYMTLWLGERAPLKFHVETPFAGYDLDEIAYMIGDYRFTKGWYIPYGGLTQETIDEVVSFDNVVLGKTMVFKFFERTQAVYVLPQFLAKLADKLNEDHNLVYMSAPLNAVWIKR